jgi:hypothetical protein
MSMLLETAIQKLKALPDERQDDFGMIMLSLVEREVPLPTIPF